VVALLQLQFNCWVWFYHYTVVGHLVGCRGAEAADAFAQAECLAGDFPGVLFCGLDN